MHYLVYTYFDDGPLPLTRVFRNPKFDPVIFLSEPHQACTTDSRYCQTQKDVEKWMSRDAFAVIVEKLFHAANYEGL